MKIMKKAEEKDAGRQTYTQREVFNVYNVTQKEDISLFFWGEGLSKVNFVFNIARGCN